MSGSVATIAELRCLRHAHRSLVAARRALLAAGVEVPTALDVLVTETGDREVTLLVPCVLCREESPVLVRVDDGLDAEPSAVLCDVCDARADDDVLGPVARGGDGER
ncbi:MAG: hypothetical protein ACYCXY_13755 [Acidimicrobiales bacterium]